MLQAGLASLSRAAPGLGNAAYLRDNAAVFRLLQDLLMSQADYPDDPRPQAPEAPGPNECCQSGCIPCVYDMYDEAMGEYREALKAWLARHPEAAA